MSRCCRRNPGFQLSNYKDQQNDFLEPFDESSGVVVPLPLFAWAPGDDGQVDPTRISLPNVRVFYDTVAALVAAGVPAPSFLHPCQEAAGTGTVADVTGNGANLTAQGNVLQGRRTPALWNPSSNNFYGYYRRAIEAAFSSATAGFVCPNPALGDPGAGDMALFCVYRLYGYSTSRLTLSQKKNSTGSGWALTADANGCNFYAETTTGVARESSIGSGSAWSGAVVATFVYVNRTSNTAQSWDSRTGWNVVSDWSAMGANPIQTTSSLTLFAGSTPFENSSPSQILYHSLWFGANATLMATNWNTLWPILWPYSYTANDYPGGPLANYQGTSSWTDSVVGDDPATGLTIATFMRQPPSLSPAGTFAFHHDPLISRRSKIVVAASASIVQTRNEYTDRVENANWIKTGTIVSATWADMADGPDGFHQARRVTATAPSGNMQDATPTTNGRLYTIDFFHLRGLPMASNVAGRLVAYDITNGVEIASQAFTATDKWGRTYLEFVATSISTGLRIEITTNGESIHVTRCCIYEYGFQDAPIQRGNDSPYWTTPPSSHWKTMPTPEETLDPAEGEVEIRVRRYSTYPPSADEYLFTVKQGTGAANSANKRHIWLDSSNQIHATIYNSLGVLSASMVTAAIDMTTETLIRLRWNIAGLPSGNTAELIINTNPPISGSVVPWTVSLTADNYVFAARYSSDGSDSFCGSFNYVKIWETPQ